MSNENLIKHRLKIAMNNANIKQQELADITHIPKASISQYLSGYAKPKSDKIYLMAKALNIDEAWLLGYEPTAIQKPNVVKTTVLSDVAAGIPIDATENILEYEEITPRMASHGEYFALRIKDDSMQPKMDSGDVVIVRHQSNVESGDTAVILVNEDTVTVKRIEKNEQGIVLVANNPVVFPPKFYSYADIEKLPVQILGKVVELRVKF